MDAIMFNSSQLRYFLLAAVRGDILKIQRYLERDQWPVDLTYQGKPSALGYAAMRGHLGLVDYLLDHEADVNYSDRLGQTPLFYATLSNYPTVVSLLLLRGANLYHQNQFGDTALILALRRPSLHGCAEILAQPDAAFVRPRVNSRLH
jgi:uncharacterized protein